MLGRNPGVYHDPAEFFALTYPTVRMRDLVRDVTRRLAGVSERAVRQLLDEQTHKGRSAEQQRYLAAYPFHPDLIEIFYRKWAGLECFQQTRGILKTLATALRDAAAWDRQPLVGAQVFRSTWTGACGPGPRPPGTWTTA